MAIDTYTLSFAEIFDKVSKLKSKKDKVAFLRQYQTDSLRMVIKSSFDPKIKWALPDGEVPYKPNDAPEGTEHSNLSYEARKLYHYIEGGNPTLVQNKREMMFVGLLESLHPDEARKLYHFIKGGNSAITQNKREMMFVQMLEGLHKAEAELLIAAKDKVLHQKYKGLSENVVKEAFDWDDNYMVIADEAYPQAPGSAAG